MNREEILRRARNRKPHTPDEMELQVVQRGGNIATFCILVFCLILMIAKIAADQSWYDVYSLFFVGMSAQHLYKWFKLRQVHELVIGLATGLAALAALAFYLWTVLS